MFYLFSMWREQEHVISPGPWPVWSLYFLFRIRETSNDHAHSCPRMAKFSGFLRVCGGSPNPARLERELLLATEAKSNSWNSLGWIKKMFQSMLETFAGSSQFPQFTKLEIAGRRHFIVWWIGLPIRWNRNFGQINSSAAINSMLLSFAQTPGAKHSKTHLLHFVRNIMALTHDLNLDISI